MGRGDGGGPVYPSAPFDALPVPCPPALTETAVSTGPMPTYPNGVIMIPHHKTWPPDGVQTSLQYDVRANSWATGPSPVLRIGQYAVTMGSFE